MRRSPVTDPCGANEAFHFAYHGHRVLDPANIDGDLPAVGCLYRDGDVGLTLAQPGAHGLCEDRTRPTGAKRHGKELHGAGRCPGLGGATEVGCWAAELDSVFARVAGRFARADLRWRMRDYVRGLLGQAARKNGWQLAEWAGHRTPDGFQRLLNSSVWEADALRDDVRAYVAERLAPDGVLIIDDTGFIKKGTTARCA